MFMAWESWQPTNGSTQKMKSKQKVVPVFLAQFQRALEGNTCLPTWICPLFPVPAAFFFKGVSTWTSRQTIPLSNSHLCLEVMVSKSVDLFDIWLIFLRVGCNKKMPIMYEIIHASINHFEPYRSFGITLPYLVRMYWLSTLSFLVFLTYRLF